jgi:hypothetical protein
VAEKSRHMNQITKKKTLSSIPKINVKGGSPTLLAGCGGLSFTLKEQQKPLFKGLS